MDQWALRRKYGSPSDPERVYTYTNLHGLHGGSTANALYGENGCCKCLRAFCRCKDTSDVHKSLLSSQIILRDLVIHIFFLVIFSIAAFVIQNPKTYAFTHTMQNLFVEQRFTVDEKKISFQDIASKYQFEQYLETVLVDTFYTAIASNGTVSDNEGIIGEENKVLGLARVRQKRVKKEPCLLANLFKDITSCYGYFSTGNEDQSPKNGTKGGDILWKYKTVGKRIVKHYPGRFSSYDPGGYTQLLPNTSSETTKTFRLLVDNKWIDRSTRVVLLEFNIYNANINLFCIVNLGIEFPPTGGALTSSDIHSYKFFRYHQKNDFFVLVCEGLIVAFLAYFIIKEIIQMFREGCKYWKQFWSYFEVAIILNMMTSILLNVSRTVFGEKELKDKLKNTDQYLDLSNTIAAVQDIYDDNVAVGVFLVWIKLFKFLTFSKTLSRFSSTLKYCARDFIGFTLIFLIVYFAFAQLGYLLFGANSGEFNTLLKSCFTLLRIVVGDVTFVTLHDINPVTGPIFFILYVLCVLFAIINLFLGIINDTYSEAQVYRDLQENDHDVADALNRIYLRFKRKVLCKKEKLDDCQTILETEEEDRIPYKEWARDLTLRGYQNDEIDQLFRMYDLNQDEYLDREEQLLMLEDLEKQRQGYKDDLNALETEKRNRDMTMVFWPSKNQHTARRLSKVEKNISTTNSKMSDCLLRLKILELQKVERTDELQKLLKSNMKPEEILAALEKRIVQDTEGLQTNAAMGATMKKRHTEPTPRVTMISRKSVGQGMMPPPLL